MCRLRKNGPAPSGRSWSVLATACAIALAGIYPHIPGDPREATLRFLQVIALLAGIATVLPDGAPRISALAAAASAAGGLGVISISGVGVLLLGITALAGLAVSTSSVPKQRRDRAIAAGIVLGFVALATLLTSAAR